MAKTTKIRKHYTLEPETVEIIKQIAKEEKRNENSVVDLLIQAAVKKEASEK